MFPVFPVQRSGMTRYSRKPAAFALLLSLAAGLTALGATGQFHRSGADGNSIDALERAIASGRNDVATWSSYAQALQEKKDFVHAAAAYGRALELQPAEGEIQKLRFNAALCLGQSGNADAFFTSFAQLTSTDPKLAVDVLDRPELAGLRADSRWAAAASSARAQAAD